MNVDRVLETFTRHGVASIVLTGIDPFRHRLSAVGPYLWIQDSETNLQHVACALVDLEAEWGPREEMWTLTSLHSDWLQTQRIFCLLSAEGPIGILRGSNGFEGEFDFLLSCCIDRHTSNGISYRTFSDGDLFVGAPADRHFSNLIYDLDSEETLREELKREKMYDPVLRWRHIQETITWAEANMPAHLRRNVPRVPKWNPPVALDSGVSGEGNSDRKT